MTVSSVAGASAGKTQITVSPAKSVQANKYKYKIQSSDFTLPELDDDLTAWSDWDGTSEIDATNGYTIAVAETEPDYSCERVGKTIVVSASPEPQGEVYTDGGTTLTITTDASTGTKSFTWEETGEETITGTAKDSVPQTEGVDTAYFLDTGTKYYLVEITGDTTQCTMVFDNAGIYNQARFGTGQNATYAYIPLEPTEHKGAYELTIEAVSGASGYNILFDSTAQYLAELTIPGGVPVTVAMGDYGFVNGINYPQGTKAQFEANVNVEASNTQLVSIICGTEQDEETFNLIFWETSKYTLLTGNTNTFTRIDSTVSDVNKLSGTWVFDDSESEIFTLTYLDTTTDEFEITYDEDDNQVLVHVD